MKLLRMKLLWIGIKKPPKTRESIQVRRWILGEAWREIWKESGTQKDYKTREKREIRMKVSRTFWERRKKWCAKNGYEVKESEKISTWEIDNFLLSKKLLSLKMWYQGGRVGPSLIIVGAYSFLCAPENWREVKKRVSMQVISKSSTAFTRKQKKVRQFLWKRLKVHSSRQKKQFLI